MASVWDDPELASSDEYFSFDKVGDSASGFVKVVRTHRFDDGKVVPQILLLGQDGVDRTLTAGQIRLKTTLVEQRPEPGDWLVVTLTQIEKRAGGKELKHFDVQITRGAYPQLAQQAQAPAPPPAYAPPVAPPQTYPAAPPAYAPPVAPPAAPAYPQVPQQPYAPPAPPAQQVPQAPPAPPQAPPAAPLPTAPGVDPAAAEAALAALTPEQRALLFPNG